MKIAVLGAPKSGKTKFAKGLARNFNANPDERFPENFAVTDRYVEKLATRTGLAFGHFAGYPENFMVLGERLSTEYAVAKKHPNQIVCGTIIDTILYCAMHGDVALNKTPEDIRSEYVRASATMQALGMLQTDTWTYDHAFYLPYTQEQKGIGNLKNTDVDPANPTWDMIFDKMLGQFLDQVDAPVVSLNAPVKDRVKLAREVIDLVENDENETSPSE